MENEIIRQQKTKNMENEIIRQQELLQDDLLEILDGLDSDILENVCQAVVERFEILLESVPEGL